MTIFLIWIMTAMAMVCGGVLAVYVVVNRVKEMTWKNVAILAGLFYVSWVLAMVAVKIN